MRRRPHPIPLPVGWLLAAAVVLLVAVAWSITWPSPASQPTATEGAAQVWLPVEAEVETAWIPGYEQGPHLSAHAAILFDNVTGTVLYALNPFATRAPASTTKILTAILALERGRLDDLVTVSRHAAGTRGSSARLYTGQKIRMRDLLHGLLLRSGNDAAVAVAEHIAGSEKKFVELMNRRAAAFGATRSRFQNPHGLDKPGHFSTAYDLMLLARVALLYPTFQEIVATKSYDYEGDTWYNTNRLLWRYEGVEGVKTGTTSKAGYCLVAAAQQNGMQLITVVLGSSNRWRDSSALLDYGFNQFHVVTLAGRGDVLARFPLPGSRLPVVAVAKEPLAVVVRDEDVGQVSTQLTLEKPLRAPIRAGQILGHVGVRVGNRLVKQVSLVAAANVQRRPWFLRFLHAAGALFTPAREEPFPPSTS